jgi:DNA-binding FadR family transcriptional regulator
MYDGLVPALATAMRLTCPRLSAPNLQAIGTRVEQGSRLPCKPGWERKAAAHAQLYWLLADAVDDPVVVPVLRMGAELVRDLAVTAGPGSDGLITNAHRRLLARLGAADADAAEHETERYLRSLYLMADLAGHSSPNPAAAVVS